MAEAEQSGEEQGTVVSGVAARLVVEGEVDVTVGDPARIVRVLLPAGVGLPGVTDEELAAGLVAALRDRGRPIAEVLDVSAVIGGDPSLLQAVAARIDREA
ncbi:MAG: hypothetical protein WD638_10640 [Nitriliruptoraceae bacterium]